MRFRRSATSCHEGPFSDPNDASRSPFAAWSSRIHAGEGHAHDGWTETDFDRVWSAGRDGLGGAGPGGRAQSATNRPPTPWPASLRSSRNLAGYRIEIEARDGLVTLPGAAGDPGPEGRGAGPRPATSPAFAAWSTNCRSRTTRRPPGPVSARRPSRLRGGGGVWPRPDGRRHAVRHRRPVP